MSTKEILRLNQFSAKFLTERGQVTALKDINFSINRGDVVGIVGESGSGKTVMSQSILRLVEHTDAIDYEGQILFENKDLLTTKRTDLHEIRGNKISMIFQDPSSSLNPVYTVGNQIMEVLILHQKMTKREAKIEALSLLKQIGLPAPEQRMKDYPHQLSGGMQQRVMIAIALACKPKLLIADEPTTALDVTVQAQILDLFVQLKEQSEMAIIFISHDLGVVAQLCNKVKVMYLGEIVEELSIELLLEKPLHPYTNGLISSIPTFETNRNELLKTIDGTVPALKDRPSGCGFANRCPFVKEKCKVETPKLRKISENQTVRCFYAEEIYSGKVD